MEEVKMKAEKPPKTTVTYTVNPIETILDNTQTMHKNGELKDLVVTTVNTNNIVAVESSINPKGMSSKLLN